MTDDFVTQGEALLEYLNDFALFIIVVVDMHHCIVEVGIKDVARLSVDGDFHFFEDFHQTGQRFPAPAPG